MNWKTQTAAAIVTHTAPAAMPDSQQSLANDLAALIDAGSIAAGSLDFAKSVHGGYVKYGSFTPKQVDAVRNLIARSTGQAEPAPVAGPDAALGAALEAALPYVAAKDHGFAVSLLNGFKRYGSFTDKQRPYAERLANCFPASIIENPAPSAPEKAQATLCPNICATVSLTKFSRFTVGKLGLSLKNDGSCIWVKWDGAIVGVIDTATTAYRATRRYVSGNYQHAQALEALLKVEADPMQAAKDNGVLTGRCSCCSRPLTDPVSIAIGIGPICLGQF